MIFRKIALAAACLAVPAGAAQAETLRIEGLYPAGSDEAVFVSALAIEQFAGADGPRLSFILEDRLRGITIGGEPWFYISSSRSEGLSDAVMQGFVETAFVESAFRETREVCAERNDDNDCVRYREVEANCLRVEATLAPELRLVGETGYVIWNSTDRYTHTERYCPEFDAKPDFASVIEGWLDRSANNARHALAPRYRVRDIRIMESRSGLSGDARGMFRDAVRLTNSDEPAACDMFEALFSGNPEQPSLMFNTGLCAEQRGDFELAVTRYRMALGNDRSDDEALEGLARIAERRRANRQLADRADHFSFPE